MRIAIFDYRAISRNPAGGCHLALLRSLAREHEFTVFAVEFQNPDPSRIEWVRVPVPKRPLALLFISFHLLAPLSYLWHCLSHRISFDLVQSVESNLSFGDLAYAHFSHTSYLRRDHPPHTGLRGWLRWLDHACHSLVEKLRFRHVPLIVVPSQGLADELRRDLHLPEHRIKVISNPVAVEKYQCPTIFDAPAFRTQLQIAPTDVACVFCALGHFERKGLPLLFEALADPELRRIKLVIVGGESDLVEAYRIRARNRGIESQTAFVGFQDDCRPFLWSADAFVLPSAYETFSLAAYEAAAAGLPIIAPPLNGISDILLDGDTGLLIEPIAPSVTAALKRLLHMPQAERQRMGENAKKVASVYTTERFVDKWNALYRSWPISLANATAVTSRPPRQIPLSNLTDNHR